MNRYPTNFSVALLLFSLLTVACSSSTDKVGADTGGVDDSGALDAGAVDTGTHLDARPADDSASTDGKPLDAGAHDGGDSGAADTSTVTPSSDLVLQKFEVTNASTGKGGATSPDYSTKIIAGAIQSVTTEDASCIDLRSTGFSGSGATIVSETVVALLHAPLSDASNKAISAAICALGPATCKVTISVVRPSLAECAIEQPQFGPDGFETGRLHFALDGHGPMPRMSDACVTGLYVDSWNHAAHSKEAKTYLTSLGIDLTSPPPQLALVQSKGATYEHLFSFGFID
jgi:hypothetical protein